MVQTPTHDPYYTAQAIAKDSKELSLAENNSDIEISSIYSKGKAESHIDKNCQ